MLKHVIAREFKVLLYTKAQIVSIVTTAVLVIAGITAVHLIKENSNNEDANKTTVAKVAVAPEMKDFVPALEHSKIIQPVLIEAQEDYGQRLSSEAAKDEPAFEILLGGTPDAPKIFRYGDEAESGMIVPVIQKVLTLAQADQLFGGLAPEQAEKLDHAMSAPVVVVSAEKNAIFSNLAGYITAIVIVCFILFAVITGLSTLTAGVVEEKSSRVVEILLSAIKPRTLLVGKILGIGAFILFQTVIYAFAAIVTLAVTGMLDFSIVDSSVLIWFPVWLLLGFFTYISIAGGMAAMVSRQEDLGAIITPFILFLFVPFYLGIYLVPFAPEWTLTKVLSVIPGFAPFMMPILQAFGFAGIGEVLLAVALSLVCIPLLSILAGKIYENSILRMGQRVSFKEAFSNK